MKKVIFMGTPEIAVPSLKALIDDSRFEVVLVLSQPDRPKGRGNKVSPTPVKELALEHDIPVYQPEKIKNNPEALEKLKNYAPDFFAVVAYGKILPKEILDIPRFAPVNVHFSLLPLYRGAAPVNRAILNGDGLTGVSTMKMGVGMDDGDILLVKTTPVAAKNAVQLAEELAVTGAQLLVETLAGYENIVPQVQEHSKATPAPMMAKEDGLIDWNNMDAVYIERMVRAFVPWPTAYTYIDGKLLKIFASEVDADYKGAAGEIYSVGKDSFAIGAAKGGLIVKELQIEGKRRMSAADFIAGYKPQLGAKLG